MDKKRIQEWLSKEELNDLTRLMKLRNSRNRRKKDKKEQVKPSKADPNKQQRKIDMLNSENAHLRSEIARCKARELHSNMVI